MTRNIIILLFVSGSISFSQDILIPERFNLPCLSGKTFLKNEDGGIQMIEPEELQRRALAKATLIIPRNIQTPDPVDVYIAIDENGRVLCATVGGHMAIPEDIKKRAIAVARKWRFQPILSNTRPVKCMGDLELPTSSNAQH